MTEPRQLSLCFEAPAAPAVRRELGPATVSGYTLEGRRIEYAVRPHCFDPAWPWWDEGAYRRAIWPS